MAVATSEIQALVAEAVEGRRAALARLLSIVERGGGSAQELQRLVHPRGGSATVVGITGSPGAGKSTLTSALCEASRPVGERIGVLAIDPSSPFTGGAILGDRVRMSDHTLDPEIFIRSMATRGHLGGLSLATPAAIRVLDAVGFPWVIVETVGVGQVEVEIVGSADTTVVVVTPGWGDAVQANKAGLMEIADVFVINKSDRPGVADTDRDLQQMLMMRPTDGWVPPVLLTVAQEARGIDAVWAAVADHRQWLEHSGEGARRRRRRVADELRNVVASLLAARAEIHGTGADFEYWSEEVAGRRVDPWTAAERLLELPVTRPHT